MMESFAQKKTFLQRAEGTRLEIIMANKYSIEIRPKNDPDRHVLRRAGSGRRVAQLCASQLAYNSRWPLIRYGGRCLSPEHEETLKRYAQDMLKWLAKKTNTLSAH